MLRRIETAIYRFLKRREEKRQLAQQATAVVESDDATSAARINAETILIALAERRPICRHCMNPYQPHERSFPEIVRLRAILMIPDREPDPMLCDGCYDTAVAAYNFQATNIGTRNDGADNLALRLLG